MTEKKLSFEIEVEEKGFIYVVESYNTLGMEWRIKRYFADTKESSGYITSAPVSVLTAIADKVGIEYSIETPKEKGALRKAVVNYMKSL